MADPQASLSFLPWVRQGVASGIPTVDTLSASQPGVAQLQIGLSLNGASGPPVLARLRGPADVAGIDSNQVVRMEPRPSSGDFEPNHFPSVEFDRADLPWLFTPLAPGAQARLRPWLCLVTVRLQDGVALAPAAGGPLPRLQIAAPANPAEELPDLAKSWAWAHAQAASGDTTAGAVGAALDGAPQLALSRLISPRRLQPNTDYLACVVPTFEVGRKSGLGLTIDPAELNALTPSWPTAPGPSIVLPVYHHWTFRTGPGGDFASLAQRLTARPAPTGLGERPVDIAQPGFALPSTFPRPAVMNIGGALQPADAPETDPPWPAGTQVAFQAALAPIVDAAGVADTRPDEDPLLGPPLYGRWYAARTTATPGGAAWFDELNLDPRWRSVAAFGVSVVQENQEALMASAWRQAADLRHANQRVRQLQLTLTVGSNLYTRHFGKLDDDGVLRVGAPAFGRVRAPMGSDTRSRTIVARLTDSAVPIAATSPAMRRIARARGPVTRRLVAVIDGRPGAGRPTATAAAGPAAAPPTVGIISRNWLGGLKLAFDTPLTVQIASLATISAIRTQMGGNPSVRGYAQVTAQLVTNAGPAPLFTVVAEGQAVHVSHPPPMRPPVTDSPSAAAFRQAATIHLTRIDPGRGAAAPKPPIPFNIGDFRTTVLKGLDPRATVTSLARAVIAVGPGISPPVDTPASAAVGVDTVMMAPRFPQPMYEPLSNLSQELLLPGLEAVLPDSVIGLKTNRRFVEAYMIGLNGEMGSELLWRGFPTDQRGTYFDQFWDTRGAPQPRADIDPPITWGARGLGQAPAGATGTDNERFVMLARGALLQRYPNAIIYAVRATKANGFRTPSLAPQDETYPMFCGALQPDLFFFGFPLSAAQVTGADGSDGHYVVIQEHPTEPRFGLDANQPLTAASVSVSAGAPSGMSTQGFQWGRNSAHMAGIVRRLPVRVAIHGSRLSAAPAAPPE